MSAEKNMALWERVSKTDPRHVKPITGKQYSGNSPKPYYIVERLTEEFGPCGDGWGFSVVNERFERFSDTDSLHVALVEFWYINEGQERCSFQQMGQTKSSYTSSQGKFILDEDAPKKSVTDALVKCASYLGFAGDIFSGRWDDSKYVASLKKEFAEEESALARDLKASGSVGAEPEVTDTPADEVMLKRLEKSIEVARETKLGPRAAAAVEAAEALDQITKTELLKLAKRVEGTAGVSDAFDLIKDQGLSNDERNYLWGHLSSKIRSALKHEGQIRALKFNQPETV